MVCPKNKIRLKTSQVVKNRNAIMEKGKRTPSLVCSLFFNIKTAPNDARTNPNSSGWCDHEINPSIPKRS